MSPGEGAYAVSQKQARVDMWRALVGDQRVMTIMDYATADIVNARMSYIHHAGILIEEKLQEMHSIQGRKKNR